MSFVRPLRLGLGASACGGKIGGVSTRRACRNAREMSSAGIGWSCANRNRNRNHNPARWTGEDFGDGLPGSAFADSLQSPRRPAVDFSAPMALEQNSRPGCPQRLGCYCQFVMLHHGVEEACQWSAGLRPALHTRTMAHVESFIGFGQCGTVHGLSRLKTGAPRRRSAGLNPSWLHKPSRRFNTNSIFDILSAGKAAMRRSIFALSTPASPARSSPTPVAATVVLEN